MKFEYFLSGFFIGIVTLMVFVLILNDASNNIIRKRAIQQNFAEYNSTTGEFQWTNDKVKFVFEGGEE